MRPVPTVQHQRSVARVLDVAIGASVAITMTTLEAPDAVFALVLLYDDPDQGSTRFWERLLETGAGVVAATVLGLLVPWTPSRSGADEPAPPVT